MAKEEFIRKISLLTSKRNIELGINFVNLLSVMFGPEVFGELRKVVLEKNGEDKIVRDSN